MNYNSKLGFSLLELLIIISMMGILIGLGGFAYSNMRRQSTTLEYKNHADNISRILSSMYKAGIYGNDKKYQFKGAYPSVETMTSIAFDDNITLLSSIIRNYDETNIEFVCAEGNFENNFDIRHLLPSKVPLSLTDAEVQTFLKNNYNLIIYQPLHSSTSGSPKQLCQEQVEAKDDCREAVIYYVGFKNHKYQLMESNRLRAGIEE